MSKLIAGAILALAAATMAPGALAASDCTRDYAQCLNDSYDLTGAFQSMADLECGAEYANCVASKLKFW
jgi:hypothetical protein